jgi:hypothetical protein
MFLMTGLHITSYNLLVSQRRSWRGRLGVETPGQGSSSSQTSSFVMFAKKTPGWLDDGGLSASSSYSYITLVSTYAWTVTNKPDSSRKISR